MSDLTLSEERFNELLGRFKQAIERPLPARGPDGACLGLERMRRLALAGEKPDAEAAHHLQDCPACARQLERLEALMPHLPMRVLLGSERGMLTPAEACAVDRHLALAGCSWCRERAQSVHEVEGRIAEWREPLPLPHPDALAAGTRGLSAVAASGDASLEAEFAEEGSHLVLEVRTRDAGLNHSLVGYLLYGRQRRSVLEGFVVLRPDVDGWFTGCAAFTRGDIYARLSGCCERIVVSPVPPAVLSSTEHSSLLASVAARDTTSHRAWSRWLANTETWLGADSAPRMPPTPRHQLRVLLAELRACLEPGELRTS